MDSKSAIAKISKKPTRLPSLASLLKKPIKLNNMEERYTIEQFHQALEFIGLKPAELLQKIESQKEAERARKKKKYQEDQTLKERVLTLVESGLDLETTDKLNRDERNRAIILYTKMKDSNSQFEVKRRRAAGEKERRLRKSELLREAQAVTDSLEYLSERFLPEKIKQIEEAKQSRKKDSTRVRARVTRPSGNLKPQQSIPSNQEESTDSFVSDAKQFYSQLDTHSASKICGSCGVSRSPDFFAEHEINIQHPRLAILSGNFEVLSGNLNSAIIPSVVTDCFLEQSISLCKQCSAALSNSRKPKLSRANGFDFGLIPPCLKDLTLIEQRMIALAVPIQTVYSVVGGQRATKGNLINFANEIQDIAKRLPRFDIETGISFTVEVPNPINHTKRRYRYRPDRILQALLWLKQHNPLYSRVEIDSAALEKDKTFFASVIAQQSNDSELELNSVDEYDNEAKEEIDLNRSAILESVSSDDPTLILELPGESGSDVNRSSNYGVANDHGVSNSFTFVPLDVETNQSHQMEESLPQAIEYNSSVNGNNCNSESRSRSRSNLNRRSNQSLNLEQFTRALAEHDHPHLILMCFPHLFPYGRGGWNDSRDLEVHFGHDYFRKLLYYHDRRFERDPHLIFWLLNTFLRHRSRGVILAASNSMEGKYDEGTVTAGDLRKAVEMVGKNSRSLSKVASLVHRGERLLSRLTPFAKPIPGTSSHMSYCRKQLMSMLGSQTLPVPVPTLFLTLSSNDLQWPELLKMINPTLTDEQVQKLDKTERAKMIIAHPVQSAQHFRDRVLAMHKNVLNGKSQPLGKVVDFWCRVEAQMRGSLHLHGLFWIEEMKDAVELLQTQEGREKIAEFVDQHYTAWLNPITGIDSESNINGEPNWDVSLKLGDPELLYINDEFSVYRNMLQDESQDTGEVCKIDVVAIPPAPRVEPAAVRAPFLPLHHPESQKRIYGLIMAYNKHQHTWSCLKKSNKKQSIKENLRVGSIKKSDCRYSFPREVRPNTVIEFQVERMNSKETESDSANINGSASSLISSSQPNIVPNKASTNVKKGVLRVHLKRSQPNINNFNPIISTLWAANTDVSFIANPTGAAVYTGKYVSKGDKADQTTFTRAFVQRLSRIESESNIRAQLRAMTNSTIAVREFGAQEAAYILLGHPLVESSRVVVYIDVAKAGQGSVTVIPAEKFATVADDSSSFAQNGVNSRKGLFDNYMARPKTEEFEKMSISDFYCKYQVYAAPLKGKRRPLKRNFDEIDENKVLEDARLQELQLPESMKENDLEHDCSNFFEVNCPDIDELIELDEDSEEINALETLKIFLDDDSVELIARHSGYDLSHWQKKLKENLKEKSNNRIYLSTQETRWIVKREVGAVVAPNRHIPMNLSDYKYCFMILLLHFPFRDRERELDNLTENQIVELANQKLSSTSNFSIQSAIQLAGETNEAIHKLPLPADYNEGRSDDVNLDSSVPSDFKDEPELQLHGIDAEQFIDNQDPIESSEWEKYNAMMQDDNQATMDSESILRNGVENTLITQPSFITQLSIELKYKQNSLVKMDSNSYLQHSKFILKMKQLRENEALDQLNLESDATMVNESKQIKLEKKLIESIPLLNREQQLAVLMLHHAFVSKQQLLMVVTGPGGTGKSFLINTIVNYTRYFYMTNAQSNADEHKGGNKGPIIVAAPTGAAALVINGQTIHRAFHISNSDAANQNNAQLSHKLQRDLDGVEVIILDEMSMIAPKQLKNINDRLNMAFPDPARVRPQGLEVDVNKNSTQLFGGRHIIIAGDFCQLPPVKCPHGLYSSENIDQNLVSGRELFLKFNTVVELSKQLRQQGDTSFSSILNRVRVGNVENNDLEVLNSRIGSESEIKARLQQTAKSGQSVLWCAATHNKVNRLNSQNLNLLANLKQRAIVNIYAQHLMSSSNPLMKVSGAFSDSYNYAEEMPEEEEQLQVDEDLDFSTTQKKQKRNNVSYRYFCHDKDTLIHLFNLKPGSQDDRLAPVLQLVKGARVMLIKNLAVKLGLVNGAIGTVIGFLYQENEESQPVAPLLNFQEYICVLTEEKRMPQIPIVLVQFDPEWYNGNSWHPTIPRVVAIPPESGRLSLTKQTTTTFYYRLQLPLTYAWAVTIHKTQGRTIDHIVIDPEGIFDRGMAYVAISRTKSLQGLHLLSQLKPAAILQREADNNLVKIELQRLHDLFTETLRNATELGLFRQPIQDILLYNCSEYSNNMQTLFEKQVNEMELLD